MIGRVAVERQEYVCEYGVCVRWWGFNSVNFDRIGARFAYFGQVVEGIC